MTTDQTDHREQADRLMREAASDPDDYVGAYEHLLAALHDGQAEQTEWLHRIRDLLAVMAEPKGDPCPCGCRRDVEPCGRGCHSIEQGCPVHDPDAPEPAPESVTVTLPRDVVEVTSTVGWRANADMLRLRNFRVSAGLLNALADALDAANRGQS